METLPLKIQSFVDYCYADIDLWAFPFTATPYVHTDVDDTCWIIQLDGSDY